jgi:hypothetical protein
MPIPRLQIYLACEGVWDPESRIWDPSKKGGGGSAPHPSIACTALAAYGLPFAVR